MTHKIEELLGEHCYIPYHPTSFEKLLSSTIKHTAMKTNGFLRHERRQWAQTFHFFEKSCMLLCETAASPCKQKLQAPIEINKF